MQYGFSVGLNRRRLDAAPAPVDNQDERNIEVPLYVGVQADL